MTRIADLMETGQDYEAPYFAYDEEFSERLIKRYKLNCTSEALRAALIHAGDRYIAIGPLGFRLFPNQPSAENAIKPFRKAVSEFQRNMWLLSSLDFTDIASRMEQGRVRLGATKGQREWRPCKTGRDFRFHFRAMIAVLEKAAADMETTLAKTEAPPKRGRRPEKGLEEFVLPMARFWQTATGRPFTVDYTTERGGKNAVRFIVDALRRLDDVPAESIVSAARKVRKSLVADKKSRRRS